MRKMLLLVAVILLCGCTNKTNKNIEAEYRMFASSVESIPYVYNYMLPESVVEKVKQFEKTSVFPTYRITAMFYEKGAKSEKDDLGSVALYKNGEKIYEEIKGDQQTFLNVVGYTNETLAVNKTKFKYTGNCSYQLEGYICNSVATDLGMNHINKDFSDEYVIKLDTFIPVKNYSSMHNDDLYKSNDDINYLFKPVKLEILVKGILNSDQVSSKGVYSQTFNMGEVFIDNEDLLKLIEDNQLEELIPVTYLVNTTNSNIEQEVKDVYSPVNIQRVPWN